MTIPIQSQLNKSTNLGKPNKPLQFFYLLTTNLQQLQQRKTIPELIIAHYFKTPSIKNNSQQPELLIPRRPNTTAIPETPSYSNKEQSVPRIVN